MAEGYASPSGSSPEPDGAVGQVRVQVVVVVDPLVVPVAQGDGVAEVGAAALGPGLSVVQLAPGVGAVAAVGGAGVVVQARGHSLGFGEQARLAAQVESDRVLAQHGGDEPDVAGQAAGLSGGDGLAGVEAGDLERFVQRGVVDGDHDG